MACRRPGDSSGRVRDWLTPVVVVTVESQSGAKSWQHSARDKVHRGNGVHPPYIFHRHLHPVTTRRPPQLIFWSFGATIDAYMPNSDISQNGSTTRCSNC